MIWLPGKLSAILVQVVFFWSNWWRGARVLERSGKISHNSSPTQGTTTVRKHFWVKELRLGHILSLVLVSDPQQKCCGLSTPQTSAGRSTSTASASAQPPLAS